MKYCEECKSEELLVGCNHCRAEKIADLITDNIKLKAENKFLKNELELIDEQQS